MNKNKILVIVTSLLLSLVMVFQNPLETYAASSVGWTNTTNTDTVGIDFYVRTSEGSYISSNPLGTAHFYYFEIPVHLVFKHLYKCTSPYVFSDDMYTVDMIWASAGVSCTYNFDNLISDVEFSSMSQSLSVLCGSENFELGALNANNRYTGAVVFPSDLPVLNAVTFYNTYDFLLCFTMKFSSTDGYGTVHFEFSEYGAIELWNQRSPGTGYYSVLMDEVKSLSSSTAGVQGAIEDQTGLLEEELGRQNELTDELINGYDSSAGDTTNDNLSDSLNSYDEVQSEVIDTAIGNLDSYTIGSGGIAGYAAALLTTFPLVSSMMQSIFSSAGNFAIVITAGFTLTIVCMVLGISKFFVR